MRANRKLKTVLGGKTLAESLPEGDARPGAWKLMLKGVEVKENKNRHEPTIIDGKIVEEVANGVPNSEIEAKYELRDGYVRDALVRQFGSVDVMKRALQHMCSETAIALIGHAMANIKSIPAGQAIIAAKVMIDGGLAIEKSRIEKPDTIDFGMLAALGETLERIEKRVTGTDRTLPASASG